MQPRCVGQVHDGNLTGETRLSTWIFGIVICEVQVGKRNGDIIWRRARRGEYAEAERLLRMMNSRPPKPK